MKWNKQDGGVQTSADGRYIVMRATTDPEQWVAYCVSAFGTTATKIGEPLPNIEKARQCCEHYEPLRKRA